MLEKLKKWIQPGTIDYLFAIFVIILLTVGIVMMFSASYVSANNKYGDPLYFFSKQAMYGAVGLVLMFVLSHVRLSLYKRYLFLILAVTVVMLVALILVSLIKYHDLGVQRWLVIGPVRIQPSEPAKLALILFCAKVCSLKNNMDSGLLSRSCNTGMKRSLILIVTFSALIVLEKHLSGTILILLIGFFMMVYGGLDVKWIVLVIAMVIFGIALLVIIGEPLIVKLPIDPYQQKRLIAWVDKASDPTGARWQSNQSLYAIGSGSFFGVGFGQSKQKFLYMPEPQNDFVFAIVCEEIGFAGAVLILALFAALIWRGFMIGIRCRDRFSSLVVLGITSHVALQTILNVLVVTDVLPNTGIGLPFFSAGGSALLILLVEMGLVLSASRASRVEKQ